MGYQITKTLPSLKEALEAILSRCFPDIEHSPYNYVKACNGFPIDMDISFSEFDSSRIGSLSARLVEFVPVSGKIKEDERYDVIKSAFYKKTNDPLRYGLNPFVEWNHKSVSGWLSEKQTKMNDSTLFRGTAFYTLGLLSCADYKEYITYCFGRLGIEEDVERIVDCAALLNWEDELVLFLTYIILGCSNGIEWTEKKIAIFEKFVHKKMSDAKNAELVERAWLKDVCVFRPRTVLDIKEIGSMQDYYVRPHFSSCGEECDEPIARLNSANVSVRQLLVGRTGMGKSMYAQLASVSMCRELLQNQEDAALIEEKMPIIKGKYVIYLPANMFSYCYGKDEYKEWTSDLVTLYFNCVINLLGVYNFDKREFRRERVDYGLSGISIGKGLLEYIKALAAAGRLVLVADSFDEIVAGKMRNAYLKALHSFYENYCNCPLGIGAHVLVTSREMSPDTMENLAAAIGISAYSANVIHIDPMTRTQQQELISNWDRNYNSGIHEYLGQLDNHFFTDLCSNPYMLSVICSKTGRKLNNVVNILIKEIIAYRILPVANDLNNDILRSVLEPKQIIGILQELAFDTLLQCCPHFSIELLSSHCQRSLADLELSDEEYNYCFDIIVNLFTTAVGLIVPADKEDERFQFISEFFRYELAAAKLASGKYKTDDDRIKYCSSVVNKISDDRDYLDLMIPLICKTESAPFNEAMIKSLVFRSYSAENEFIVNRALIDLIMSRYGGSIVAQIPNKKSTDYFYQLCADRMVIIRLLSAPNFSPTEEEKKAILKSNAFRVCDGFINDLQRKSLEGGE